MTLPRYLTSRIDHLPEQPGVYRLKAGDQTTLYVGKSKNLRDRVRTYFHPTPSSRKVSHLRARTKEVDFLVLGTDHQAREVEWDVIRSHRPEYNTLYLDTFHRPYIKLTVGDPYPRIELTQFKEDDGSEYYGPYRSTRRLRTILTALRDTFPLRDCDLKIPEGGDPDRFRSCFEHDLGRCSAPCVGLESTEVYRRRLGPVRNFLEGNYQPVLEQLETRMNEAADRLNFEAAALYRDRLDAVRNLVEYRPFIRSVLRTDVWARHGNRLVGLMVRGHRLDNFRILQLDGPPFRNLENHYRNHPLPGSVHVDPDMEEWFPESTGVNQEDSEEITRLRRTAERTARIHDRVARHRVDSPGIVDRLQLGTHESMLVRRVDGEQTDTQTLEGSPERLLEHRLVPRYEHGIEQGVPLPDELIIEAPPEMTEPGPDLFTDVPFQVPVRVERIQPG